MAENIDFGLSICGATPKGHPAGDGVIWQKAISLRHAGAMSPERLEAELLSWAVEKNLQPWHDGLRAT